MSTGLTSASALITNIISTNVSSGTLNLSTGLTTGSIYSTGINLQQVTSTASSTYHEFNQSSGTVRGIVGLTVGSVILGSLTNTPLDFYTNSVINGRISTSGNLTVIGDITGFGTLSDIRLKENINEIDIQEALNTIKNLRPVTFDWKNDIFNVSKRGTNDVGFIAQEVEAVAPLAVSEYQSVNDIIYKNIKHERLIPYLVSAIQYLLAREL